MERLRGQPQDGEARERLATAGSCCYPRAEGAAGQGGFIGARRLGPAGARTKDRDFQGAGTT